jgi:hypothetical protein
MATTTIHAPDSFAVALSTAYDSTIYQLAGCRRASVQLDDAAIGFTVEVKYLKGGNATAVERIRAAGGEWWEEFSYPTAVQIRVKSASGTPNADFLVS